MYYPLVATRCWVDLKMWGTCGTFRTQETCRPSVERVRFEQLSLLGGFKCLLNHNKQLVGFNPSFHWLVVYSGFSTTLGMIGWDDKHTDILYFLDGLKTIKKRISYEHVEQKQGQHHEKNRLGDLCEITTLPGSGAVPRPGGGVHRCHVFLSFERRLRATCPRPLFFGGDLKISEVWTWRTWRTWNSEFDGFWWI